MDGTSIFRPSFDYPSILLRLFGTATANLVGKNFSKTCRRVSIRNYIWKQQKMQGNSEIKFQSFPSGLNKAAVSPGY